MKRLFWLAGSSVVLPLLVAACGGEDPPLVDTDSGTAPDGAPLVDSSLPDTALPDGARPDVTPPPVDSGADTARPDTGTDGGAPDGSVTDASTDGGPVDAAVDARDAAPPPQTCGVGFPDMCLTGERCRDSDDCEGLCTLGVCAAPSYTDGKLSPSLGETDVDCGGPAAAADPALRCEPEAACVGDTDCKSEACSPKTKTCAAGRSCSSTAAQGVSGIETCGAGETPAPAGHESCCATLPLPVTTTRRLDKYEITAGRIRRFVAAITAQYAGVANVRAWAKAYAAANPTSQLGVIDANYPGLLDIMPATATPAARLSLVTALGLFSVDPINASDGCYVGNGSEGHSTYFWDAATRNVFRMPPRVHAQGTLDEKPINCTNSLMYMAFCAWDGGELARMEDYREVWGNQPAAVGTATIYHPWDALLSIGQFNWRNGQHGVPPGGFTCPIDWPGCVPMPLPPAVGPTQAVFYRYPTRNADNSAINLANDSSPLMSAPGRFTMDVTAATSANGQGWYDVAGLDLETGWVDNPPSAAPVPVNSRIMDYCDTSASPGAGETGCTRVDTGGVARNGVLRYSGPLPHLPLVGYSWEGHARYNEAYLAGRTANPNSWKPVTWQYGKAGGRCARTY